MRTLYLECGMGAAGDMLAAALLELLPDADGFVRELNAIGIPGTVFKSEPSVKCGITGTHITVTVNGEEEESHDYSHELGQPQDHDHSHEVGQYHDHNHDHEAGQHQDHDHSHESGHHSDHDHSHESGHHHDHDHSHESGHHQDHDHSHEAGQHYDHDHSHESGHHHHNHHHSGLHDIEHIVRGHLGLPERIQDHVMAVYGLIAEAESHAHGVPVTQIHFHEVGAMDAIADITAVCMLMDRLAVDEVVVSPVHVGSGQVRCAHGILPVPAPATAYILKDVPIYGGSVRGELCTPTGAALIKHFATRFGDMPVMKIQRIGYGMGKKDFEAANCVRAMLGETGTGREEICELSCNVDDMTGEAIGFAMDRLFEAGALDVYTVPVGMKKSRPGVLLCVMYRENDRDAIIRTVFKYTASIGIRENKLGRYVLDRRIEEVETVYGSIRCKVSSGYGVERRKYEYDDISRIAKEYGVTLEEVVSKIQS